MPDERSPLLNGQPHSFTQRVVACVKPEGQPGFIKSYRNLFFSSYFNLFLVFIPLAGVSHYADWDAGFRFVFSFLAIIPLAKVRLLSRRICLRLKSSLSNASLLVKLLMQCRRNWVKL